MGFLKNLLGEKQVGERQNSATPKTSSRNTNICPSCGFAFAEPPKRKTRCESCGKELYVRTKQTIFNSDLLTEEDALSVDFFDELKYLGATDDDYRRTEEKLRKRWGFKPKSDDVVWGASNQLIMHPPEIEKDYEPRVSLLQHAKQVTFLQAKYLANKGKDPTFCLRDSNNFDIKINDLRDYGVTHFVIETTGCCGNCSKHQSERYSPKQLKAKPVLPIEECTNKLKSEDKYPWCTCCYSPDTRI